MVIELQGLILGRFDSHHTPPNDLGSLYLMGVFNIHFLIMSNKF